MIRFKMDDCFVLLSYNKVSIIKLLAKAGNDMSNERTKPRNTFAVRVCQSKERILVRENELQQ